MIGITIGMLMLIAPAASTSRPRSRASLLASVSDQIERALCARHDRARNRTGGLLWRDRPAERNGIDAVAVRHHQYRARLRQQPGDHAGAHPGIRGRHGRLLPPNLSAQSEIPAIRRVSTTSAAAATASATTGRLPAEPACGSDPVPFVFDTSAAAFTLQTKACTSSALAPLRAAVVRIFYLAACDNCAGSGDGIPTLKMAELINGAFRVNSIAQGIQDMHFSFGVDQTTTAPPTATSTIPASTTAAPARASPAIRITPSANWHNVTSVRISLAGAHHHPRQRLDRHAPVRPRAEQPERAVQRWLQAPCLRAGCPAGQRSRPEGVGHAIAATAQAGARAGHDARRHADLHGHLPPCW